MMEQQLKQLAICIEKGKVDNNSPYPPDMKGQDGAHETGERIVLGSPQICAR